MGCGCGGKSAARKAARVKEAPTDGAWKVDWPDSTTTYYSVKVAGQADIYRRGYTLEQLDAVRNR